MLLRTLRHGMSSPNGRASMVQRVAKTAIEWFLDAIAPVTTAYTNDVCLPRLKHQDSFVPVQAPILLNAMRVDLASVHFASENMLSRERREMGDVVRQINPALGPASCSCRWRTPASLVQRLKSR